VTVEKEALIRQLAAEGHAKAVIGRTVGVSRKTIHEVLKRSAPDAV
jgi:hypothetical protein